MTKFSHGLIDILRTQWEGELKNAELWERSRDGYLKSARAAQEGVVCSAARAEELASLLSYADPANADVYKAGSGTTTRDMAKRERFLDGLRKLIEFYELHPDVPVPSNPQFTLYAHNAEPDEEIAGTARIAELMGVKAYRQEPNDHFRGTLVFGGSVTLEAVSCKRTDSTWHTGDPLPAWFVQEQALYGGEDAAPTPDQAPGDEAPEQAATGLAGARWCGECGGSVDVARVRRGIGDASRLVDLCRTCHTLAIEAGEYLEAAA